MAELTGSLIGYAHRTTETVTTAAYPVGQRGIDGSGNEYRYVKFTDANYNGGWCVFDGSWNATRPATTSRGALGICQANAAANDYGWAKVYGIEDAAQINDSEATSAYGLIAPTGATTEPEMHVTSSMLTSVVSGAIQNPVVGAWIKAAATTATTGSSSNFTGATVQVFLNYPMLTGLTIERFGTT
jgi:hypothetical protein